MKLKKRKQRPLQWALMAIILFLGIISIINWALNLVATQERGQQERTPRVSEQVRQYEPLVASYAKTNGVLEYKDVLLSIMMQESGGGGDDPMQSSESRCGKPGCIKDPEQSIQSGVAHFSKMLDEADGDLELAVQSYNFGRGFIQFAQREAGGYTQEAAIDFSKQMYAKAEDKEKYRCLRPEAREINACYGDMYYVQAVMKYRPAFAES